MTPPFVLGILASSQVIAAAGDYESIATVTVGSGGAANVEFTSIPGTYTHLQIRGISRSTTAATGEDEVRIQVNSDTGNNYSRHYLYGTGSAVGATGTATTSYGFLATAPRDNNTASIYGVAVIDILDYANTNKYKTMRSLSGDDRNGSGNVQLCSALWQSTSAITSIKLYPEQNNFKQYTSFALYGCKI